MGVGTERNGGDWRGGREKNSLVLSRRFVTFKKKTTTVTTPFLLLLLLLLLLVVYKRSRSRHSFRVGVK